MTLNDQYIDKILLRLILFAEILSCKKDGSFRKHEFLAALNQMDWFKKMAVPCCESSIGKTYIYMAVYNHEPVVYSMSSGPLSDPCFSVQLYNLDGEVVKSYSGSDQYAAFEKEVTHYDLIYRCDN